MKEIELDELKESQLRLLRILDRWCDQNGCRYSLSGGTLIGAIRHGGYIPWDDDIDVMMPREDYQRLIAEYQDGENGAKVLCYEKDARYIPLFVKFSDCNSVLFEDYVPEYGVGVNIDIFPIDSIDDRFAKARKKLRKMKLTRLFATISTNTEFQCKRGNALRKFFKYLVYRYAKVKGNAYWHKKMQKLIRKNTVPTANYVGCALGGYFEKEVFPREAFDAYVDVSFEGQTFKMIQGYDSYLRALFGDYMQLPPEEKRITHHTYSAYHLTEKNDE